MFGQRRRCVYVSRFAVVHAQGFQARAPLWLFSEGMEGAEGAQRVRVSYLPSASITAWSTNPLPSSNTNFVFYCTYFLRVCLLTWRLYCSHAEENSSRPLLPSCNRSCKPSFLSCTSRHKKWGFLSSGSLGMGAAIQGTACVVLHTSPKSSFSGRFFRFGSCVTWYKLSRKHRIRPTISRGGKCSVILATPLRKRTPYITRLKKL